MCSFACFPATISIQIHKYKLRISVVQNESFVSRIINIIGINKELGQHLLKGKYIPIQFRATVWTTNLILKILVSSTSYLLI